MIVVSGEYLQKYAFYVLEMRLFICFLQLENYTFCTFFNYKDYLCDCSGEYLQKYAFLCISKAVIYLLFAT